MSVTSNHRHTSFPDGLKAGVELADQGLILGSDTCLVRMKGQSLALDEDLARALALLPVAFGPVIKGDFLLHVAAASGHWRRGDRALANLRLALAADLPRLAEPADAYRLRLAEHLLDEGMTPAALMKELGSTHRSSPNIRPTSCACRPVRGAPAVNGLAHWVPLLHF